MYLQQADESSVFVKPLQLDRRSLLGAGFVGGASAAGGLIRSKAEAAEEVFAASSSRMIPTWKLQNGVEMPILALNTVGLSTEDTERALAIAVQEGITHVDFHPGKERDGVANYLRNHNRTGLFLNTKIRKATPGTSPQDAAERTRVQIEDDLQALGGLKQVDMIMLRDSPDCKVIQSQWAVLEDALARGQTRSVGVVNFCESALTCLLATAKVKPALNYFMYVLNDTLRELGYIFDLLHVHSTLTVRSSFRFQATRGHGP
jgi:diketogulonate reductase-like aldo/keto reductase